MLLVSRVVLRDCDPYSTVSEIENPAVCRTLLSFLVTSENTGLLRFDQNLTSNSDRFQVYTSQQCLKKTAIEFGTMSGPDASETTPLLRPPPSSPPTTATSQTQSKYQSLDFKTLFRTSANHLQKWRTIYLCGAFVLFVSLPGNAGEVARIRMYELNLCRHYYNHHDQSMIDDNGDVPEMLCKIDEIQAELAKLRGIKNLLDELLSIVLLVPYGLLADIRGRKFVIYLSLAGMFLGDMWIVIVMYCWQFFPIKAMFASSAFQLIGGGNNVAVALFFSMIADVCTPNTR